MCLEIFPERICAAQTNGIDQSLVRFTLVWYGLISLLCTKQWFLTSHHPTNMQITTMLAARQNLAVGKTSPRHLSPICYILLVPGVPNDVGRHPQWNMWNFPKSTLSQRLAPSNLPKNSEVPIVSEVWSSVASCSQGYWCPADKHLSCAVVALSAGFCFVMFRPPPNGSEFGR
jgi:hypothetical protein